MAARHAAGMASQKEQAARRRAAKAEKRERTMGRVDHEDDGDGESAGAGDTQQFPFDTAPMESFPFTGEGLG